MWWADSELLRNPALRLYLTVACYAIISILKTFFTQLGWHLLFSSLIILGGLFIYMSIAYSIGYLSYSDRPGPGWTDKSFGIDWETLLFIGNFVLFLGIYVIGTLLILYLLFKIFVLIGFNRIVYSIIGGITIGFLCFYWTAGIGWYIAIDFSTILVGGILGSIYGATLFPTFLNPTLKSSSRIS